MAHLWFRDAEDVWAVMPLDGRVVDVSVCPPRVMEEGPPEESQGVVLIRTGADSSVWVLLVRNGGEVRINGFAPVAGLRVLQNRDEIRAPGRDSLFFSTETLARTERFVAAERPVFCPRCRGPIKDGDFSVRCPQCRLQYHQTQDLPCWIYATKCAMCTQATALDTGFTWTPEA